MNDDSLPSTEDFLESRKNALLAELETIAPVPTLELRKVLAAQQGVMSGLNPGEYAAVHRAIDAVVLHLKKNGGSMPRLQLIREILQLGFQPASKRREFNLRDSIRYEFENPKHLTFYADDVIGLVETDEGDERVLLHLAGRFTGMRPLVAIRCLIEENGGPMPEEQLVQKLIENGLTAGKKRAHHNIKISLDVSERTGSLVRRDGMVGLPDALPLRTAR